MLAFDLVPMRVLPPVFFAMFSYWSIGLHTKCVGCVLFFTRAPPLRLFKHHGQKWSLSVQQSMALLATPGGICAWPCLTPRRRNRMH